MLDTNLSIPVESIWAHISANIVQNCMVQPGILGNSCCMRCFRSPQPVVQSRKAATPQAGCLGKCPAGAEAAARGGGSVLEAPPQGICSLSMPGGTGGDTKGHLGFCRSQPLATAVDADLSKNAEL